MLSESNKTHLKNLESNIRTLFKTTSRTQQEDRQLCDCHRMILRIYQDTIEENLRGEYRSPDALENKLSSLARDAILYLGGEGDRPSVSLKDYDHNKYGPFLGVSDEGSAASIIRKVALESPKMKAIGYISPIIVGVAHDAERLGAIGEIPVGPEEYANIRLECTKRILTSTNVGTRLKLQYYKRFPVVTIRKGPIEKVLNIAKKELKDTFTPFLNTPDGQLRPLNVYIEFDRESRRNFKDRVNILLSLAKYIEDKKIADLSIHKLGLQMRIGYGSKGRNASLLAIDLASEAGLEEVAIDGVMRKEAIDKILLPGLYNYLSPALVDPILRRAHEKNIRIRLRNSVDPDTVARGIWSALNTARHMGLELGKYGTFPLTLEECDEVVGRVQPWFKDWTAAPVFFVDQGTLSNERTYINRDIVAGLMRWLEIMKDHEVPVVLIDTLDKSKGWRLLRSNGDPRGLLSTNEINEINELAVTWGIKVLWAGGISLPQAFAFGKMRVFGIYVTSAAAKQTRVSEAYEKDPLLSSLKEPSIEGVSRVKLLLESGFLVSSVQDPSIARELERLSNSLIDAITHDSIEIEVNRAQDNLFERVLFAWKVYLKSHT